MNACYPTLPGKESKAKCCPMSSTQKYSSQSSNPEHGMETSLSTETEAQAGVSQLPAPYQGDLGKLPGSDWGLCLSSLPAWARRKCHPAPTQRARWYLTAAVLKSCTRKNIFSCSWAVPRRLQSWSGTSLVHLPQNAGWDNRGCGTKRLRMTIGPVPVTPRSTVGRGEDSAYTAGNVPILKMPGWSKKTTRILQRDLL